MKKTKIYAIANQKGGCGKSITSVSLLAGLAKRGYKVLGIDLDAQMCLTTTLKAKTDGASILSVLLGEAGIEKAIQHTPEGVDVVPASRGLSQAKDLFTKTGKEYLLKEALEPVKKKYDYIILDNNPSLDILTVNALTVADSVIIPIQADTYSLDGINYLMETITPIRKYCNPDLKIEGLLFTIYDTRATISKDILEVASQIAENLNSKIFKAKIRQSTKVKEAISNRKSLFEYEPKAKVTQDYSQLIDELTEEVTK